MTTPAAATFEPLDSLVPWAKNPRLNDDAVDDVARSIERFGFGAPIIARTSDRRIIAGHTRWKAASRLGLDVVPVRFLDLTDSEATALTLADNRLGELAEWSDGLADILRTLEDDEALDGLGWDSDELAALLVDDIDENVEDLDVGEISFSVVVETIDERIQSALLQELEKRGFKCRALML